VEAAKGTAEQTSDEELRQFLERSLSDGCVGAPVIAGVDRTRSKYSSSYETEILTVRLAGGTDLQLFLKDFGARRYAKDQMTQRRWRELRVYQDLLADSDLGTARYYGAAWDESRRRYWLLLEFVSGVQVRYCEFDQWVRAAGWLGRMQAHFAERIDSLHERDFLIRHDAEFFSSTAALAARAVSLISPRLHERLQAVVSRYDELVAVMVDEPPTLVHGGYHPQNILVTGSAEWPRLCPTDWEEAALGSQFYDFAYFSDGFEPQRLAVLMDAYREAAAANGLQVPAGPAADRVVGCFHVHKSLGTLAKAYDRQFPYSGVEKLVGMVESAAKGVL
jgi:aminoglycoside phosphotransferase (APT) family kinase protein